jgi:hypothetical protein
MAWPEESRRATPGSAYDFWPYHATAWPTCRACPTSCQESQRLCETVPEVVCPKAVDPSCLVRHYASVKSEHREYQAQESRRVIRPDDHRRTSG